MHCGEGEAQVQHTCCDRLETEGPLLLSPVAQLSGHPYLNWSVASGKLEEQENNLNS